MKGISIICPMCKIATKPAKLRFQGYDIPGSRCRKCGEEYFDPDESHRILYLNKLKMRGMEVKLGQIRSNLIIRIPVEMSGAMGLSKGGTVTLKLKDENTILVETQ